MRVAIVGSRSFGDYVFFERKIKEWEAVHGVITTVVSGGASGVDWMAEQYAVKNNRQKVIHKPDWDRHGKAAGPIRNSVIVGDGLDYLIAFPGPDSIGTHDTIRKAKEKGIVVFVVDVPT